MLLDQAWRQRAACRGKPLSWFFAPEGGKGHYGRAKKLCAECPVRVECLAFAMQQEPPGAPRLYRHGLWGGLTPQERGLLAGEYEEAVWPIEAVERA